MSDNEVIVSIEPELLDFESTRNDARQRAGALAPVVNASGCCHD